MVKFFRIFASSLLILAFLLVGLKPARPARAARLNILASSLAKSRAASAAALSCAQPVRIMPLGDSITQGKSSGEADPARQISYRLDLWTRLASAGYEVDLVGSEVWGNFYQPQGFDPDNEGHGGIRDDEVASCIYDENGSTCVSEYGSTNWLGNHPADVILLHIGTNDLDPDPSDVALILDEIKDYEDDQQREVWVILARIINRSCREDNPACAEAATTTDFNESVEAMALDRINNLGDKILLVDMEDGADIDYHLLSSGGDMWDNLHPYISGYNKMAAVWEDTLVDLLPFCARDDSLTIQEDSSTVTIDVLANDGGSNISIQPFTQSPSTVGTVELDSVNQNFKYTPPTDFVGTDTFTYWIPDGPAGSDTQAVVTVDVTPVNDPPSISPIVDQATNEDTSTGPISFAIGDDETPLNNLALSAASSDPSIILDGNITFSGSGGSRTVAVLPAANRNTPGEPVTITIRVRDAGNLEAASSFKLSISPVDDPPTVANPGSQFWAAGEDVSLQIVASDPDGDPLNYSASGLPQGVSIGTNSGLISGSIPVGSVGKYTVEVFVSSGNKTASVGFTVQVGRFEFFLPELFK